MAYTEEPPSAGRSLGGLLWGLLILGLIVAAVTVVATLPEHSRKELLFIAQDYLPIVMFLTLAALLFSGYPVAFVLGGVALTFGLIGYFLGTFKLIARHSGKALDLANGSPANGAAVRQWPDNGMDAQKWAMEITP